MNDEAARLREVITEKKEILSDIFARYSTAVLSFDQYGPYSKKDVDFRNAIRPIVETPATTDNWCSALTRGELPKIFIDCKCSVGCHKNKPSGLLYPESLFITMGSKKFVHPFPICNPGDLCPELWERLKWKGCSITQAAHIRQHLSSMDLTEADDFIRAYIFEDQIDSEPEDDSPGEDNEDSPRDKQVISAASRSDNEGRQDGNSPSGAKVDSQQNSTPSGGPKDAERTTAGQLNLQGFTTVLSRSTALSSIGLDSSRVAVGNVVRDQQI